MPNIVTPAPVCVQVSGAVVTLIPENDVARELLNAFFTAYGAKTTIAVTQAGTPRDGLGSTGGIYKNLILTLS